MLRPFFTTVGLMGCSFVFASLVSAQESPPPSTATPEFVRESDIIYHKKGGVALTMDRVTPQGDGNGAAVVVVVSGGWFSDHTAIRPHDTDKLPGFYRENATELLRRGYTVFYVVHGTQPKYTIREIHDQISAAIRYVRFHSKDWGIDSNRIGITGASAGGHLSLMQGTKGQDGDTNKEGKSGVSNRVQAVVAYYPPTDFTNYGSDGVLFDKVVREVLNGQNPFLHALDFIELDLATQRLKKVTDTARLAEHYEAIGPRYHVTKDDAPTLLLHGDADRLVPIQQSKLIATEFEAQGVPHELYVKDGADHGWTVTSTEASMVADWFDKHLMK